MEYEFKHYRRAKGSSTGVLGGKHPVDGADATTAIVSSWPLLGNLRPLTDFAILKDADRKYVRGWGVAPETAVASPC